MDTAEEHRIAFVLSEIHRVADDTGSCSTDWDQYIAAARSVIQIVSSTSLMQRPDRRADQVLIIFALQRLAYHDADAGGVQDIAEWCVNQWLRLLQHDNENIDALQGLGQGWLSRAQMLSLEYIGKRAALPVVTAAEDQEQVIVCPTHPATKPETLQEQSQKPMLAFTLQTTLKHEAAEAFMSLGNVSYSNTNEHYFRQALVYLRRASQLPNFTLSPYLQNYLDDYGRLID